MKRLLIISLSLLVVAVSYAQSVKKRQLEAPITSKIQKKLPSVYISFENYSKSPKRNEDSIDVAWFRLHNNLRTTITFYVYDNSISNTGKPGIRYEIERVPDDTAYLEKPTLLAFFPSSDSLDKYKLKGGSSYLFGVPYGAISKDSRVKVAFTYPWESEDDNFLGKEVAHFAYFYGTNLVTHP